MKEKQEELYYKYCNWDDYAKDSISKRYFWFSKPTNFNDPFDCNMDILNAFPESKNIFSKINEGAETRFAYLKRNTDQFGILCLTAKTSKGEIGDKGYNNLHFWSHYANSYKGICIGFKKIDYEKYYSEKLICKVPLFKVIYLDESFNLDNYEFEVTSNKTQKISEIFGTYIDLKNRELFFEQILLLKHKRIWAIENEYRVILGGTAINKLNDINPFNIKDETGLGYKLPYPEKDCIKEVTFGVNFDRKEIESAIKEISKNNKGVSFYKSELSFLNTDITRKKISVLE